MTDAGEIIKSGAGEKIADLVNKLAGPLAEEAGMMLGDTVRVYRVKNWIRTVQKTVRLLRDSGLPVNAVPPRLFLPIMEASSVENNETLQDMWAGLLATASQQTDSVSPAFIETLKQLTPEEAKYFQRVYDDALKEKRQRHSHRWKKALERRPELSVLDKKVANSPISITVFPPVRSKSQVGPDTYERLGLIRRMYDVSTSHSREESDLVFRFVFTEYADKFMRACQGPSAASSESDTTTPKPGH